MTGEELRYKQVNQLAVVLAEFLVRSEENIRQTYTLLRQHQTAKH